MERKKVWNIGVVENEKATKSNLACFDVKKCADCPLADKCSTLEQKKYMFIISRMKIIKRIHEIGKLKNYL